MHEDGAVKASYRLCNCNVSVSVAAIQNKHTTINSCIPTLAYKIKVCFIFFNQASRALTGWIQHLTNHVWWSAASCEGDEKKLREMVLSMNFHVTNRHAAFPGHELFTKCAHPELSK